MIIRKVDDEFHIKFIQNSKGLAKRKDICAIGFGLSESRFQDGFNKFSMMFYRFLNRVDNYKR